MAASSIKQDSEIEQKTSPSPVIPYPPRTPKPSPQPSEKETPPQEQNPVPPTATSALSTARNINCDIFHAALLDRDPDADLDLGCGRRKRQWLTDSLVVGCKGLRLLKRLGGHGTSTVYKAETVVKRGDLQKSEKVAVKVMNWQSVAGCYQRSIMSNLVSTYVKIPPHPNIIKAREHFVDGDSHFLTMDWCRGCSLAAALGPKGLFSRGMAESNARAITLQICLGLEFLRKQNLPHGRLTLENILFDGETVRLMDYGYPPSTCSDRTEDETHLRHRAPEIIRGRPVTAYHADIWSLGVVLYAMTHGRMPFSVQDLVYAERAINLPRLTYRATLTLPCTIFNRKLLTYCALFRPTLPEVMAEPWLNIKKKPLARPGHMRCMEEQGEGGPEEQITRKDFPSALSSSTMQSLRERASGPAAKTGGGHVEKSEGEMKGRIVREATSTKAETKTQLSTKHKGKPRRDSVGRRIAPRVEILFDLYGPCDVTSENVYLDPVTMENDNARRKRSRTLSPERAAREIRAAKETNARELREVREQFKEYLAYSEKVRSRFFKYYANIIPASCRYFPLPPLLIIGADKVFRQSRKRHFSAA